MVRGIEKITEYFSEHTDKYAIIGGVACELLFDEAGLPLGRVTKDIDMVFCVEVIGRDFGEQIRVFLEDGGYQAIERGDGKKQYFRFSKPIHQDFPTEIELFSRRSETLNLPKDFNFSRISVEEDSVSLSAILLNDDYYQAIQQSKRIIRGVTVIDEQLLIPFKARAYLDLTERLSNGERIDKKKVRKHVNDLFRLLQILPANVSIRVPESIERDLKHFIELVKDDVSIDPLSFKVKMTRQDGIDLLASAYGIF